MNGKQLVLDVSLREASSFENFIVGDNGLLIDALQRLVKTATIAQMTNELQEFCYCIWGSTGSGKTHLLEALLDRFQIAGKRTAYYPLEDWRDFNPEMLRQDTQSADLLCVDDLQHILGQTNWEAAFFECYNQRQVTGRPLVITMLQAPQQSGFLLSDLRSRLLAGLVFPIVPIMRMADEQQQVLGLQNWAQRRGLTLPLASSKFLLTHYPRDHRSLQQALDQLSYASLEQQRRLNIPFIKKVLKL